MGISRPGGVQPGPGDVDFSDFENVTEGRVEAPATGATARREPTTRAIGHAAWSAIEKALGRGRNLPPGTTARIYKTQTTWFAPPFRPIGNPSYTVYFDTKGKAENFSVRLDENLKNPQPLGFKGKLADGAPVGGNHHQGFVLGDIILRVKDGADKEKVKKAFASVGAKEKSTIGDFAVLMNVKKGTELAAIEKLKKTGLFEYVEENGAGRVGIPEHRTSYTDLGTWTPPAPRKKA